jgi:hypothetical protein
MALPGVVTYAVLLGALVFASGAGARVVPTGAEQAPPHRLSNLAPPLIAGPALSSDGLVWAESERAGGYRLRAEGPAGIRELGDIGRATELDLDADGARIAYARHDDAPACPRGRCPRLLADEVFSGTLDSPLERIAGCRRGEAGCPVRDIPARHVLATSDAIAFSLASSSRIEVRNYDADPSAAVRRFPGGPEFALAGRYALVEAPLSGKDLDAATIFDRITGASVDAKGAVLNPSAIHADGALQDDGKALYSTAGNHYVWKFPGAATSHPVKEPGAKLAPAEECAGSNISLRQDTILWQYDRCDRRGGVTEFVLTDLAGERVARLPSIRDRAGDVAFDGTHLAWATRTCALVSLAEVTLDKATWSIGADVPRAPRIACPVPDALRPARRASASGAVTVPLRCPASARYGCAGSLSLYRRVPKSRTYYAGKAFADSENALLLAGGHARFSLQLPHRQFAILRRQGSMRVEVDVLRGARVSRAIRFVLLAPKR